MVWRHLLWSCSQFSGGSESLMLSYSAFWHSQPESSAVPLALSKRPSMAAEDLAGFDGWLCRHNCLTLNLLWALWITARFIKGHSALIWYCVCRIWPALHVFILIFIAAEMLIISKLVPDLHIVLSAVVYIKVFFCSSGTFSGKRKTNWETW